MDIAPFAAAAAIVSFLVCWLLVRFGDRLGLSQAPNHRSSHERVTPTAGGLGIVAGTLIFLLVPGLKPASLAVGLACAIVVSGLGFLDDRFTLTARHRLAIETVLVLIFLVLSGLPDTFSAQYGVVLSGAMIAVFAVISIWWLNLFNFMDGIDALAGSQAVFLSAAIPVLGLAHLEGEPELVALLAILGGALIGFLALNRPPARIFMGDVGSLFLAFVLLAMAIHAYQSHLLSPAQIAILPALFVADATLTLLVRLWQRQNVFEAHKSHAYQVLSRRWGGHLPVVAVYGAVNVLLVLPGAWAAGEWPAAGPAIALTIYTALIVAGWLVGAGRR